MTGGLVGSREEGRREATINEPVIAGRKVGVMGASAHLCSGWFWDSTSTTASHDQQNFASPLLLNPFIPFRNSLSYNPWFIMAAERPTLSLSMSDFIAPDALNSPVSDDYAYSPTAMDSFSFELPPYAYADDPTASSPGSPMLAERALKLRMTPDYSSDASMPTSQVFDLEPTPSSSREASVAASPAPSSEVTQERAPSKRPSESNIKPDAPSKKQRTERVSTKDFVPPDVSGLSKREARLVKNRAAAFLSRQRKREEFELMEVYANSPQF